MPGPIDTNPRTYDPHARVRKFIWFILAFIIVIGITGKYALDQRYAHASAVHVQQSNLLERQREKRYSEITNTSSEAHRNHWTFAQFETALGYTQPTKTNITSTGKELIYEEPLINTFVTIKVDQAGKIVGRRVRTRTTSIPRPTRYDFENWFHVISSWLSPVAGGWFTPLALVPWIAIIIWGAFNPYLRKDAAQALIVWTAFCTLMWIMSPNYTLTAKGIMSNDRLFWTAIMLIFGIPIAIHFHELTPRQWWCCSKCNYNLTGSQSATCPECGTDIPETIRKKLDTTTPDTPSSQ